jgi:conjugal transfer protein trbB
MNDFSNITSFMKDYPQLKPLEYISEEDISNLYLKPLRDKGEISEERIRNTDYILNSLGNVILSALHHPQITEMYINEDYHLRFETNIGRIDTGIEMEESTVRSICQSISGYNGQLITERTPILGVEVDTLDIRIQIMYPPTVTRPTFFIRKKPQIIYSLESYVDSGILSEKYYNTIVNLIKEHKNIVLIGATGSGKTTFLNALLKKMSELTPNDRIIILEDTPELKCSSDDVMKLMTSQNLQSVKITMRDLVYSCMRLSPNRIIVGEVRDNSAFDVLKAWNTGHAGGFLTTHANDAMDGLMRLEYLAKENSTMATEDIRSLIGSTVDALVSIQKIVTPNGTKREVTEILQLDSYDIVTQNFVYTHL